MQRAAYDLMVMMNFTLGALSLSLSLSLSFSLSLFFSLSLSFSLSDVISQHAELLITGKLIVTMDFSVDAKASVPRFTRLKHNEATG